MDWFKGQFTAPYFMGNRLFPVKMFPVSETEDETGDELSIKRTVAPVAHQNQVTTEIGYHLVMTNSSPWKNPPCYQ